LEERASTAEASASLANAVVSRMTDTTIASFVANAVIADGGATERLAAAFEALVPEPERRPQVLELAGAVARASEAGQDAGFDELWKHAAAMLTSYSDEKYVSDAYAKE